MPIKARASISVRVVTRSRVAFAVSACRAVALVSSMFYVYRLASSLATSIDRAQRSR